MKRGCASQTVHSHNPARTERTSFRPPRRPCGESWWNTLVAISERSVILQTAVYPEILGAQSIRTRKADLVAVDEALSRLTVHHPEKAELVKLRFFGGLFLQRQLRFWESHYRLPIGTGRMREHG
jgi:hypothetical protein